MSRIVRHHEISSGHRVVGDTGKNKGLHGHNFRIYFTCEPEVEKPKSKEVGLTAPTTESKFNEVHPSDIIKEKLCDWLDANWDHKFLAWRFDPVMRGTLDTIGVESQQSGEMEAINILTDSIQWTSFNPTPEKMAEYLVNVVGPAQLHGTGLSLTKVRVQETRTSFAEFEL